MQEKHPVKVLSGDGETRRQHRVESRHKAAIDLSDPLPIARLGVWREVAEETFNDLVWESEIRASIECPGGSTHSRPSKANLFLEHVPTVNCFHKNCKPAVETANHGLRSECSRRCREAGLESEWSATEKSAWIKRKRQEEQEQENLKRRAHRLRDKLPEIVDTFHRTLADWIMESPHQGVKDRPMYHLEYWLDGLFSYGDDKRIWIGTKYDSGRKHHTWNFATPSEWLQRMEGKSGLQCQWDQVCPAFFANWRKLHNRVTEAVAERRLLAVEFDHLSDQPKDNKELGLAVVRYVLEKYSLKMFSACDSGNKSVHCLLAWPQDRETYAAVTFELAALGADEGLWRMASTTGLPGAMRIDDEGFPVAWQNLYWLDPGALDGAGSSLVTHLEHQPDIQAAFRTHSPLEEEQ